MNEQEFDSLVKTTRLTEKSREAARLVYVDGKSQAEAAAAVGLSNVRVSQIMATVKKAEAERQHTAPSTSAIDLVRASYAVAVKAARDLYGDDTAIQTPGENGKFVGIVDTRTEFHLVQHLGRNTVAIHDLATLDRVPAIGKSVSIQYSNGRAAVADRAAGKERDANTR
ncbi:hypothetical protein AU476_40800 [Cupriavidus sp. UYMSc13B]|nr:hypothetical protein AU476_40800 [Cupriavidus sp. UYMSc13B]